MNPGAHRDQKSMLDPCGAGLLGGSSLTPVGARNQLDPLELQYSPFTTE